MQITKAVSSSGFDWFTSCRAIDAMVMFNTPFRGQQELSLIGAEQTTSLLVVMIFTRIPFPTVISETGFYTVYGKTNKEDV